MLCYFVSSYVTCGCAILFQGYVTCGCVIFVSSNVTCGCVILFQVVQHVVCVQSN